MDMPVKSHGDGVILMIRLTPKASKNSFGPLEADANGRSYLKAYVTTVPENGKANKTLIKMLAKALKLPAGHISVASGATNRNKQIRIEGEPQGVTEKLERWIKDLGT